VAVTYLIGGFSRQNLQDAMTAISRMAAAATRAKTNRLLLDFGSCLGQNGGAALSALRKPGAKGPDSAIGGSIGATGLIGLAIHSKDCTGDALERLQ
jgi:hypothetical protein